MTDLDAALRLNPNFADAYQNRGVIKNVLKLFSEALADFNQALKLNPDKNGAGSISDAASPNSIWATRRAPAKTGGRPRPAA